MKRFILSAAVLMLGMSALAPAALANRGSQVSTVRQLSDTTTLTGLVNHSRDARGKK